MAESRAYADVAPLVAVGRAAILHADIGPVGPWGYPRDASRLSCWQRYIALPWAEWAAAEPAGSGLCRRPLPRRCCHAVIAACAGSCAEGGGLPRLLLHDVTLERPGYLDVLTQFDLIEQVGSPCLLQPRADASAAGALASLLGRQFDPG